MKGGTQAALVLAVGYVLGRRRKLRIATVMAAAAATGGLGSLGGSALRRGLKMLGSSEVLGDLGPQFSELAETMRGDLVEAGKAAALASVNNRIGSLNDSLRDRAEAVRNPAANVADPDREYQDQDEGDDYDEEPEDENDAPPPRLRARRSPVARARR